MSDLFVRSAPLPRMRDEKNDSPKSLRRVRSLPSVSPKDKQPATKMEDAKKKKGNLFKRRSKDGVAEEGGEKKKAQSRIRISLSKVKEGMGSVAKVVSPKGKPGGYTQRLSEEDEPGSDGEVEGAGMAAASTQVSYTNPFDIMDAGWRLPGDLGYAGPALRGIGRV